MSQLKITENIANYIIYCNILTLNVYLVCNNT
jgi:hypothetical protein